MVDQMMRIAGRSSDGRATAIKIDESNHLSTSNVSLKDFNGQQYYNIWDRENQVFETEILERGNFSHGKLDLIFGNTNRDIVITLSNYRYNAYDDRYLLINEEVIFEEIIESQFQTVEYKLESFLYKIKIENLHRQQTAVAVREQKFNIVESIDTDSFSKAVGELTEVISNLSVNKSNTKTKQPVNTLKLTKLEIGRIKRMTIGYDGKYYIINDQNRIEVYNDIINDNEPEDVGNEVGEGIRHIKVVREGVVLTKNNSDDGTCQVLFSPDIHTAFDVVYQSPNDDSVYNFSSGFGLKTYDNGINTYVLIGIYGRGDSKKDLLFSRDGGQSYDVILQTQGITSGGNSHFHDVEIDSHHGLLIASEGDGSENHRISVSADFGKSWEVATNERQPTAVISFPKLIIFGRDSRLAGFDKLVKPSLSSHKYKVEPHFEIAAQRPAIHYYVNSPVKNGNEAYVAFSAFPDEEPIMVMATGDFGETWHSVHVGENAGETYIQQIFDMDKENVFVSGRTFSDGLTDLYYSKKVEWL